MPPTNTDRLVELLTGETWERLQEFMHSAAAEQKAAREILWGGPGQRGLVHTVDRLSRTVDSHHTTLYGNGSGTVGLRSQVEQHEKLAGRLERLGVWLLTLIVMQFVGVISGLGWWIFRAVAGGT